jgi:hypothetical protein
MKNTEIVLLVGGLEKGMALLERQMESANGKLDALPCTTHTSELKVLNTWKQTYNGANANRKIESFKGMVSLRNLIIAIVLTSAFSILVTLLTSFFFIGKP